MPTATPVPGTIADVSAAPKMFRISGKEYALHPFSDKDMTEMEHWTRSILVERAFQAIPDFLTESQKDKLRANVLADMAGINILDKRMHVLMVSPQGIVKLCSIGLRKDPNSKELTEEALRNYFNDTTNVTSWMEAHNEINPNFIKLRNKAKPPENQPVATEELASPS